MGQHNVCIGDHFVRGKEGYVSGPSDGNQLGREHLSEMAAFVVQQGEIVIVSGRARADRGDYQTDILLIGS